MRTFPGFGICITDTAAWAVGRSEDADSKEPWGQGKGSWAAAVEETHLWSPQDTRTRAKEWPVVLLPDRTQPASITMATSS